MSDKANDRRIDYIEFPAHDAARAKAFYSDVFGWKFEDYGPTYTSFVDGRMAGGFQADGAAAVAKPLVVIYVTDLEIAVGAVERAGGKITKTIFPFPGGRRFHFADPEGNELAVWSD